MNDNNKSTDLGKLVLDLPRRCITTEGFKQAQKYNKWWSDQYQTLKAENANLQAEIENQDLNIRNLTSLLDSIPPRHTDEELDNLAYLRDNFIDQRMVYYFHFGQCEEEARESAEEDALEHFPAPEVTQ
jgi:hypothetical protein